ncbi:phytanoyl-CoA dioxygenase family protein [Paenibacillus mendelii]|uniref:Phytanoyl-CoA dioxygenase family protein n=1 Tax=Paenibacillus mendelii TaxID=206163 RepID=A0ABV6JAD4_9BACL|nr:phytanoyl-CoA dioxygenase family protein [Paenibacillus mendelii]MCQ6560759.1 phytanoyl-CoA dioxygenase family protein [Paenibacillus mendelii]
MEDTLKEQFDRQGYVVLPQLFSEDEVRLLKEEARAVLADKGADKVGVYVGMSIASSMFKAAAAKPELAAALKEVIGDSVIFLSDKIVFKNASTDFGSPWHQDYPYWEGSHKFSVWIALDDATPENGCLRVVPGSHLLGAVRHGGDASDGMGFGNRLGQEEIKESQVADLHAAKGDAIIFHDLLFHSSFSNTSGKDRWALISTYKDGTLEDPEYPWALAAFTVSG